MRDISFPLIFDIEFDAEVKIYEQKYVKSVSIEGISITFFDKDIEELSIHDRPFYYETLTTYLEHLIELKTDLNNLKPTYDEDTYTIHGKCFMCYDENKCMDLNRSEIVRLAWKYNPDWTTIVYGEKRTKQVKKGNFKL